MKGMSKLLITLLTYRQALLHENVLQVTGNTKKNMPSIVYDSHSEWERSSSVFPVSCISPPTHWIS